MSVPPKANWKYLPHAPTSFFGLKEGFTRKDLKRAYGKQIRQFKPETHPEEFQRIRAAFETLEAQLRYGVKQAKETAQQAAWSSATSTTRDAAGKRAVEADDFATVSALAQKSPHKAWQKIAPKKTKTPQEFYLLAVLADVVKADPPQTMASWLLRGLAKHPSDRGLQNLLGVYLREDIDVRNAAGVLQNCAKVLPPAVFYRLTEPLWDKLLRGARFESFAKLLDACESTLRGSDELHRAVFYLHLLRPALFKAPPDWFATRLKRVESAALEFDAASEEELDFLIHVREYLLHREERAAYPVIQKIEKMIERYCLDSPTLMISRVVAVQDELARDSHAMMQAFPMDGKDHIGNLLPIYFHIVQDVVEQTGLTYSEESGRRLEKLANATMRDLRDSLAPIGGRIGRKRVMGYVPPYIALTLVPPVVLSLGLEISTLVATLSILWFGVTSILYVMFLKPRYLDERVDKKIYHVLEEAYASHWRARLFRYVQSTGTSPEASLGKLASLASESGASGWMDVVLAYMSDDLALLVFGRAQMFVN